MNSYCLVGEGLKAEHDELFELGREAFEALDNTAAALDAHCAECDDCRQASGMDAWVAIYDDAERDFVQDSVEY